MNYILFDDASRISLFPITLTRPVADIRIGIVTIREKWESYLSATTSSLSAAYLRTKFPVQIENQNILINGSILPNKEIIKEIQQLETGEKLVKKNTLVALHLSADQLNDCINRHGKETSLTIGSIFEKWDGRAIQSAFQFDQLRDPWDIFMKNGSAIEQDLEMMQVEHQLANISKTNRVSGNKLFIEEGARVEHAILNTESGPIYIGKNAEIMEGSMIRGPFAICEGGVVKMGAKIYGPTTVGPYSKVGGEISNCVIIGYSNKGHDGYIGNSVIGEWCNLGADTNCSNLKNNYGNIKVWSYKDEENKDTGLQFCGLIMGDHSKSGINTMFNTGTVVGVSSNIFGGDFPQKFIPSFSWGGSNGWQTFKKEKAMEVASKMMQRRKVEFSKGDEAIFTEILEMTAKFRHY